MAWRQDRVLPADRWGPKALEAYHDLVVAEAEIRGQVGHICHPKDDAETSVLLKWDAQQIEAGILPESKQSFLMDTCLMYAQELFAGGRLPASPDAVIDLIQWADASEREAALLHFKEKWSKCGSPY